MNDTLEKSRTMETFEVSYKPFLFIGPLSSTTLAVVYDVGFFLGIDINFFTFFSLSEHMVFSLQAIPIAVVAILGVSFLGLISWFSYQAGIEDSRSLDGILQNGVAPDKPPKQIKLRYQLVAITRKYPTVSNCIVVGSFISCILMLIFFRNYVMAVAMITVSGLTLSRPKWNFLPYDKQILIAVIVFGITSLIFSFAIGLQRADSLLSTRVASEIIHTEKPTLARIIRSGERGILYFSIQTRTLQFLRWDAIKLIESTN